MMKISKLLLLLTAGLLSSCSAGRVMYLDGSTTRTVQLAETKKNVKVWVRDKDGNKIMMRTDLNEGGYYRDSLK